MKKIFLSVLAFLLIPVLASGITLTADNVRTSNIIDTTSITITTPVLTATGSISAATEFQQSGVTILVGNSGATANDLLVGLGAGASLTTGSSITAVGDDALKSNTTGDDNTAIGSGALFSNIIGSENTAVGTTALFSNTGSFNDAFGWRALTANTTGTNNAAFGNASLESNTTGSDNVAIGIGALEKNILGRRNTALGVVAGVNIASATLTGENTLIGYNTGQGITTGVQNTVLGANVIGLSPTLSNNIIFADGAGVIRLQFDSSGNGVIGGGLQVTGAFKDSSGDVGTSGQLLSSTVTGTNWTTSSAGNVFNTGTPLDNQIAVWTNSTTIEGVANLTFDGTHLRTATGTELLPAYSFTTNTNRGMYDSGTSLIFADDGFDVLELIAPALAANWLQITAAKDDDSAGAIKIIPAGTDLDIEMNISSKGSQNLNLNATSAGGVNIGNGKGIEVGSNGEIGLGVGADVPTGIDGLTVQIRAATIIFGNANTKTQIEILSPADNKQLLIGINDTASNNGDAFVLAPVSSDLVLSTLKKVNVSGNYPLINFGYTTVAAETGGLIVNYLPTAITDTVSAGAFVAGVSSTSNPTVTTVGAATFSASDIIQITGTEQFENDGLFEVLTHAANLLTIRGIGTTAVVEDFTGDQFIANTSDSATITKVTLSVLRSGTDGIWESASGSTTGFSFSDLISSSTGVVKTGTPVDNQLAVWTGPSTIEGTTGLTYTGTLLTVLGGGTNVGGDIATFSNNVGSERINIIDENATGLLPPMIESEAGFGLGLAASGGELKFFAGGKTNSNLLMLLSTNGNLGVGELSPNSRLHLGGSFAVKRLATAVSANTADEVIIGVTDTTAARTITIQTSDIVVGRLFIIKDESGAAGTNNITIATQASETIDGATTATISTNYGVVRLYVASTTTLFIW